MPDHALEHQIRFTVLLLLSMQGLKRLASSAETTPARLSKRVASVTEQSIKTDQEILAIAEKDISIVKAALTSADADATDKLQSAPNLVAAYQEFMKKGRVQGIHPRTWEMQPSSEVIFHNTIASSSGLCTQCRNTERCRL